MDELIIKEREFRESVVKLTNESGLPAFIMKHFFEEIKSQLEKIEVQQYEIAMKNKKQEELEKQEKGE